MEAPSDLVTAGGLLVGMNCLQYLLSTSQLYRTKRSGLRPQETMDLWRSLDEKHLRGPVSGTFYYATNAGRAAAHFIFGRYNPE